MKFEIWYSQKELSYSLVAEDATPRWRHFLCKNSTLVSNFAADDYVAAKKEYDVKKKEHWQTQLEREAETVSGV